MPKKKLMEKITKSFSDDLIKKVLTQYADISSYLIYQPGNINTASIEYRADGKLWSLIEEDDGFADACIKYLIRNCVPVITDIEELKKLMESKN